MNKMDNNLQKQLQILEEKLAELENNNSGVMNEDATKEMIKNQLKQQISEIRQRLERN
jgi:hypothetical protein